MVAVAALVETVIHSFPLAFAASQAQKSCYIQPK
jgi:hypothetical protein